MLSVTVSEEVRLLYGRVVHADFSLNTRYLPLEQRQFCVHLPRSLINVICGVMAVKLGGAVEAECVT